MSLLDFDLQMDKFENNQSIEIPINSRLMISNQVFETNLFPINFLNNN